MDYVQLHTTYVRSYVYTNTSYIQIARNNQIYKIIDIKYIFKGCALLGNGNTVIFINPLGDLLKIQWNSLRIPGFTQDAESLLTVYSFEDFRLRQHSSVVNLYVP